MQYLVDGKICFTLLMLINLFCSANTSVATNGGINIFFLPVDEMILSFLLLLLFIFFLYISLEHKKIRTDAILYLLIGRFLLLFVTAIWNPEQAWGNIIPYFISILIYLYFINTATTFSDIYPLLKVSLLLLFAQAILLLVNSPVSYFHGSYKYYFVAPLGASNIFAAHVCMIAMLIILKEKSFSKICWIAIAGITVLLTKSRNSLLFLGLAVIADLFFEFWHTKKIYKSYLVILAVIFICSACAFLLYGNQIQDILSSFINGFMEGNDGGNFWDSISSGRISLLKQDWSVIKQSPIFGNGFKFELGNAVPHNIVIEILYVSGIVGIFVNFFLLLNVISRKNNDYEKNYEYRFFVFFVIAISMLEKVLFTFFSDLFLWGIIALFSNEFEDDKIRYMHG